MSSVRPLLSSLRKLFQTWYGVDRIRISPTAGRLLQLKVDDSVVLFNELYTVTQRQIDVTLQSDVIRYALRHAGGIHELRVIRHAGTVKTSGELITEGSPVSVTDADVVIVQPEVLPTFAEESPMRYPLHRRHE